MAYKGGIKVKSRHPILKGVLGTVLSLVCVAIVTVVVWVSATSIIGQKKTDEVNLGIQDGTNVSAPADDEAENLESGNDNSSESEEDDLADNDPNREDDIPTPGLGR